MTYTISQVAKRCGVSAHTLRYYEKEGLLPFVARSPSGIRRFKEEDFEALAIINCLKDTGMPIKGIKTFMDWCTQGDKTIQQRYDMFIEQKRRLQAQLSLLKTHMKKINYKIWYYQTALEAGTLAIHDANKCVKRHKTPQKAAGPMKSKSR